MSVTIKTSKGLALDSKLAAGANLQFSRAVMGSGKADASQLEVQEDVLQPVRELTLQEISYKEGGTAELPVLLTNIGVSTSSVAYQLGIFAIDPDEGEILYIIRQDEDGERIPTEAEEPGFTAEWLFLIKYGNAELVEVELDPAGLVTYKGGDNRYLPKADLEAHKIDPEAHFDIRVRMDELEALAKASKSIAERARDSAAAAQDTADTALSAAGQAQSSADGAQATADSAMSAAAGAQLTANEAKELGAEAKAAAETAQETADIALDAITNLTHTIDAVPTQHGTLSYTGSVQSPSWNSYNTDMLTLSGITTGTNAGTYTAVFTPLDGYKWSDGTTTAKSVTWTIGRATIASVPTQSGTLTYSGSAQSPSWSGYNSAQLTIGGTHSAIDADSYNASFTPTSNYRWSGGMAETKSAAWNIARATIAATPSQSGTLTYTGSAQIPSWSNYSSTQLTLGGTSSSTNAGSYTATFTPKSNYCWADGSITAKSVNWTIGRANIELVPTQSGSITYTGTAVTANWANYDTRMLTIGGTYSTANAGTHTATFTPTSNYRWWDGTTGAKSAAWTISKAPGSLSIDTALLELNLDKPTATIAVTRAGDGKITAKSNDTTVATVTVSGSSIIVNNVNQTNGEAIITISVAAGTNHNAPASTTCTVTASFISTTLAENSWETIADVSKSGEAQNYWNIGDEKDITLSTGEVLTLQIYGFDHDDLADGSGKAGITFGMKNLMISQRQMTYSGAYNTGFIASDLYKWLSATLRNSLPAALRSAILPVSKKTYNNYGGVVSTDTMSLFLFSLSECNEKLVGTAAKDEGNPYPILTDTASCIKKLANGSGAVDWWWLRSGDPYSGTTLPTRGHWTIGVRGYPDVSNVDYTNGINFGFCV